MSVIIAIINIGWTEAPILELPTGCLTRIPVARSCRSVWVNAYLSSVDCMAFPALYTVRRAVIIGFGHTAPLRGADFGQTATVLGTLPHYHW